MTITIEEHFIINEKTVLLAPGRNINYESKVIELDGEHYVREPILDIIDNSSREHNLSPYEFSRQAMVEIFNFRKKAPFPSIQTGNCLFPTHRIKSLDCHWISALYLDKVISLEDTGKSLIIFTNGYELSLDVSSGIIRRQFNRCQQVIERINQIRYNPYIAGPIREPLFLKEKKRDKIWIP